MMKSLTPKTNVVLTLKTLIEEARNLHDLLLYSDCEIDEDFEELAAAVGISTGLINSAFESVRKGKEERSRR